jgi:endogenous inhibitor of DNA gyrase (YacG/DUF329 family)
MKGRCPICGKSYRIGALSELPTFPFCTERCRLVDLGRWIDGAYAIPGPELPTGSSDEDSSEPIRDDEE